MASLVILIMAGVGLGWLVPYHVPNEHDPGDLPPVLVPILSMSVCALTALLLGISAWRQKDRDQTEARDSEAAEKISWSFKNLGNLGVWLAAAAVCWLLLKYLGFIYAAGFIIAAGIWYGGIRKPWIILSAALATPLLIDNIVWYGLNIQLP